jgi:hypothetical protein
MTDFSGFVLEHSVDRGWRQFEGWLSDVLSKLEDGDVLVVSREAGPGEPGRDQQPHVRFTAFEETAVRAEAAGNRQLDRQFQLTDEQQATLTDIGFTLPSSPAAALATSASTSFSIDLARADGKEMAAQAVRALREVYGILHPAFLAISGDIHYELDAEADVEVPMPASALPLTPEGMPVSGTLASQWSLAEAGPIAMPESPEHLRQLIEQSLVPMLGRRPLVDEDGDFVIPWDGSLVFVRVVDSAPVIAVFSQLVHGVLDIEAAVHEVADLNAAVEMVKFFLVDDRIVAGCTLPANPFVGEHLRDMLALVGGVAHDFQQPLTLLAGNGPAYGA